MHLLFESKHHSTQMLPITYGNNTGLILLETHGSIPC